VTDNKNLTPAQADEIVNSYFPHGTGAGPGSPVQLPVTSNPAEHASVHGSFDVKHPRVPKGHHGGGRFTKKG
jgi:hypothetical protein